MAESADTRPEKQEPCREGRRNEKANQQRLAEKQSDVVSASNTKRRTLNPPSLDCGVAGIQVWTTFKT